MPEDAQHSTPALPVPQHGLTLARAQLGRALGFTDCPPAVLDELVGSSSLKVLRRGEFAMRDGDPSTIAVMVVTGMLESSALHLDGSRHLVGLLVPGDFAGLVGVIDGQEHINDQVARQDTLLMSTPVASFRALRRREPSVVLACERQLAYRSRLLYARLLVDPGVPVKARLGSVLLTLGTLWGRTDEGANTIEIEVSQNDLADWLGLSRQRVNFVIKQLEAEALIALRYRTITIIDPERLRASSRV